MPTMVLRLIDANYNRAREGLRVVEDYARFVRNDDQTVEALKMLRHELASALHPVLDEAILHRDTAGDVGTAISTASESSRADLADVVAANSRRVPEALRAIEEYAKTLDPRIATSMEQLRYRYYAIEQRVLRSLRPVDRFSGVRLYVLITEAICSCDWLKAAELAIDGGADCLQLREKELAAGDLLNRARKLVQLCRARDVLCIVNDRADVALLSDADGVHVGQADLSCSDARKIVGRGKIVGVSTHEIAQAKKAVSDGADYIGVGPIYKSGTKPREFVSGLSYAREVAQQISIPAAGIAGITLENVDAVLATGIKAVAVTAAVVGAADIRAAAAAFKAKLISGI